MGVKARIFPKQRAAPAETESCSLFVNLNNAKGGGSSNDGGNSTGNDDNEGNDDSADSDKKGGADDNTSDMAGVACLA
jgi:hypothetical protein